MKNCFKKIIVMFVMVLAIMGSGSIQNGVIAADKKYSDNLIPKMTQNTAPLGESKASTIYGNKYDSYNAFDKEFFSDSRSYWESSSDSMPQWISYRFESSKIINKYTIKYLDWNDTSRAPKDWIFQGSNDEKTWVDLNTQFGINFDVDEKKEFTFNNNNSYLIYRIYITDINGHSSEGVTIDEIEMMENLNDNDEQIISLDKSSLTLKENNTKNLIATTTPSALDLEWSSSEDTIATVDENGKVTGIKEGTCIITAQIKGTDVKATCEVTVTKEDIVEPEEPSIENGSLYIEMIDGNIKRADKSQIEKFKKWFISRDLDETESPIFKITNAKGNVEYLVHDKVVGFEIRE